MFNNVGGFVCQIANIILVLYSIVFYPKSMATPVSAIAHVFWLMVNAKGLLFSSSAAIMVNHMVRMEFCINLYGINCCKLDGSLVIPSSVSFSYYVSSLFPLDLLCCMVRSRISLGQFWQNHDFCPFVLLLVSIFSQKFGRIFVKFGEQDTWIRRTYGRL